MTTAELAPGAVAQFAVLDALLAGAYETGIGVEELRSLGDVGLGCCDHLGGEVVVLDGEAFECRPDGVVARMTPEEILPFAAVCRFPSLPGDRIAGADLAAFAAEVEGRLLSRNLFHALRLDGAFSSVRVRVTPRQHHPFRPLAEVASEQIETVLLDARGTIVGFWGPAIYQGIAVAGLHLHFLAEDRSAGGHVLDLAVDAAQLRIAAYAGLDLRLPTDDAFLQTELTHDDDHRIVAVEGRGARA